MSKYVILNGNKVYQVLEEPTEQTISAPDQVEPGWLYQFGEFSPGPGSLAYHKASKRSEINAIRDYKMSKPTPYLGDLFDSDRNSVLNLTSVISAFSNGVPIPENFTWRSATNKNVPMDLAKLVGLAGAILQQSNTIYNESWQKKVEVSSASTCEEVSCIGWD